jgi:hypothetical protein
MLKDIVLDSRAENGQGKIDEDAEARENRGQDMAGSDGVGLLSFLDTLKVDPA